MSVPLEPMNDQPQNRREFFRSAIRYPLLLGLVAAGGALEMRSMRLGRQSQCDVNSTCGACRLLPECQLPQARDTKLKPAR